jgi:hypothetical protein
MNASGYDRWLFRAALFALAYVMIGLVTAELGGATATHHVQMAWRLAAWGLSLAVFVAQVLVERLRCDHANVRTALHTSIAVALAALVLAAAGPVWTHRGTEEQRLALIALVAWPVITGLASFGAALVAAVVLGRVRGRAKPAASP